MAELEELKNSITGCMIDALTEGNKEIAGRCFRALVCLFTPMSEVPEGRHFVEPFPD